MLNRYICIGRLCAAPELKQTAAGTTVTSFSLAVDRVRSRAETAENTSTADFIDCVAWKETAEFICKYFTKGSQLAIEGRLQTRTYTTRSGEKRKVTEVVIERAHFTGKKEEQPADALAPAELQDITDDQLPF